MDVGGRVMFAWLAICSIATAELVPFGHADWKASPTSTVGFAGQGNNWYPGATPPVTWMETTNGVSTNILWKAPIPGWTDAQPIVVGKRLIGVYSPHHVVCYDADTGSILWQDELEIMYLPKLGSDRRTLSAAHGDTEARKLQLLWERAVAAYRMMFAVGAVYRGVGTGTTERYPLAQYVVEVLTGWRAEFEKDFPEAVKPLDADLALYALYKPGNEEEYSKVTDGRRTVPGNLVSFAEKKTEVVIGNCWQGSVSDTMATPVSDGEIVYVTFGFGQQAAYELATGKRLWAFRDPTLTAGSAAHCAAPLLWKDTLIAMAQGRISKDAVTSIRGLDKRTGAVKWEVAGGPGGSIWGPGSTHGDHMSPYLMRLPDGKGGIRAIVISNKGALLDPETGTELAQLPNTAGSEPRKNDNWGSGFVCALGNRIFKGYGGDHSAPPINVWPITVEAPDKFNVGEGYLAGPGSSHSPFALSDRVLVSGGAITDPLSGTGLGGTGGRGGTPVLLGERYLYLADSCGGGNRKHDGSDLLTLSVRVFDIANPKEPKQIGLNVIQARGYTPDITSKYFPRFAAEPALRKWAALQSGHVNYQGIGFNYATDTAGFTAHGNRIYLHSPALLYCIGEQ